MTFFDSIELILAQYKDSISEANRKQLAQSYMETLAAEADARRCKMAVDILRMNKLQLAVKKLEYQYSKISSTSGQISAIENLINSANREIRLISLRKNKTI